MNIPNINWGEYNDDDTGSYSDSSDSFDNESSTSGISNDFETNENLENCKKELQRLLDSSKPSDKETLKVKVIDIVKNDSRVLYMYLIANNYKLEVLNNKGQTALHLAMYYGYDVLKLIVEFPNYVTDNHTDCNGLNYLHIASSLSHAKLVSRCLKAGVDVNAQFHTDPKKVRSKFTPLHFAASVMLDESRKVIKLLLKNGADINAVDQKGRTPLHIACQVYEELFFFSETLGSCSSFKIVKLLSENGSDLNARDSNGNTPLLSIVPDNYNYFGFCLDEDSNSLPYIEIQKKLKYFLKKDVDFIAVNNDGNNILHCIIENLKLSRYLQKDSVDFSYDIEFAKMIKQILKAKKGINVNAKNCFGDTPLQLAVALMSLDVIEVLLQHNADVNSLTFSYSDQYCFCCPTYIPSLDVVKQVISIIKILMKNGWKLTFQDNLILIKFLVHDVTDCECGNTLSNKYEMNINILNLMDFACAKHFEEYFDKAMNALLYYNYTAKQYLVKKVSKALYYRKRYNLYMDERITDIIKKHLFRRSISKESDPNSIIDDIVRMKYIKLEGNMTLYNVMVRHPHTIYRYIKNHNFNKITEHFTYLEILLMVKGHVAKSLVRHHIEKVAVQYLRILFMPFIPVLCCRQILSFLSNTDIVNMCSAAVLEELILTGAFFMPIELRQSIVRKSTKNRPTMAFAFAAAWRSANAIRYRQDLYQAVENRDMEGMFTAMHNGAKWIFPDQYGETVLHMAVKKCCTQPGEQQKIIKILEWFLNKKVLKVDVRSRAGKTSLHMAIRNRMDEVVDYLIGRGASLDVRDERGNYIAHCMVEDEFERFFKLCRQVGTPSERRAFEREAVHFFEWMLSKNIKINCINKNRETPLQLAVKRNLLHILPILLSFSQDVSYLDSERRTVLHIFIETIKRCDHTDVHRTSNVAGVPTRCYDKSLVVNVLKLLLNKGFSVNSVDIRGNTPLHNAAMRDRPEIIEMMLKRFKNVNTTNNRRETVLHVIVDNSIDHINKQHKEEYVKFVRTLLSKGANINKVNEDGYNAVQLAIMRIHPRILQMLKNYGAKFNEPYNGGNFLHLFSQKSNKNLNVKNYEEVVGLLVSGGCDVNAKDNEGMTPLHWAAQSCRNAVIIGLVRNGANVDSRDLNPRRFTPLQKAVDVNCEYSLDTLVNSGADVNARDSRGQTALHIATRHTTGLVKILLRLGAHVDVEDDEGLLPLHYAIRRENSVAVMELLKFSADINDAETYVELVHLVDPGYVLFCILDHWIKMKAAGLPITQCYRSHVADDTFQESFHECLMEVEALKAYKIGERATLFDLLHMDWNFRCAYIISKHLKELVDSPTLEAQFPKYHVLIMASYHDAVARQPLLEPAKRAWCELTKILLPDVCIYQILSHLKNRDLRIMIDGLKDRSFRKPCRLLLNSSMKLRQKRLPLPP
ncbi:ankyrin-1-like [Phymastichus coffea]|uniref:ankyrin-1-like n=1 Tax=Phymastichus coffea TaxID=108790 RepID=UPI00273C812F|nr:ankyrin-1-like [Phymastichus coffea]